MLTEYDSPQSRALFRLLIGAAEDAKASKFGPPVRAVALRLDLPTRDVQRVAKTARPEPWGRS
jgi:hypothetical protein